MIEKIRQLTEGVERCFSIIGSSHWNDFILRADRIGTDIPYYHDAYSAGEETRNDILTAITHVESTYGVHVYCVICNRYVDLGLLCTLLTVSPDESEWPQEREDLKAMQPLAYVANLTYPEFSEWGTVLLKTHDGIVERVG